jgi:tyrosine decarboxylase
VLDELGIDTGTFVEQVVDPAHQSDKLFLLRHTLMNPWPPERVAGENYIDRYVACLERVIRAEVVVSAAA